MEIKFHTPSDALKSHVQSIMVFGLKADGQVETPVNPFPPVPQHSLFFYLRDPVEIRLAEGNSFFIGPPGLIVGPQLKRVDIRMGRDHLMLHIGFRPGGLHRLLGIPMNELVDQSYAAPDLLGPEANEVLEQLRNAKDWKEMIAITETFLLKKLRHVQQAEPFNEAITGLIESRGNRQIDDVAAAACLSLKQFERKCKERLGLPPKLFARLIRFSSAYRMREADPYASWTSICYDCGYFDQMHLIRDFKEFAGVTPRIIAGDLKKTPYRLQSNILL